MTISDIRKIQAEQGWNDSTLLQLFLNDLEVSGEDETDRWHRRFKEIADAENEGVDIFSDDIVS